MVGLLGPYQANDDISSVSNANYNRLSQALSISYRSKEVRSKLRHKKPCTIRTFVAQGFSFSEPKQITGNTYERLASLIVVRREIKNVWIASSDSLRHKVHSRIPLIFVMV